MKTITSYFMAATLLLQSLNYALVYISFSINRDYIAEVLCINRDKPEMNCKGHCQLTKKMQETEEQEKEIPAKSDEKSVSWFLNSRQIIDLNTGFFPADKKINQIYKSKPRSFIPDIFHPPKSVFHLMTEIVLTPKKG